MWGCLAQNISFLLKGFHTTSRRMRIIDISESIISNRPIKQTPHETGAIYGDILYVDSDRFAKHYHFKSDNISRDPLG
ncbi:MAG: hypothetical protein KAJ40_04030 [Alphaproteobacteria bacterium]|nr:hypothetical protein [Alphaproteobacteria bacterium]